jgi:DNA-binding winged helix-turn-helix (wHTH) protein
MNMHQLFSAVQRPHFPRVLVSTEAMFKDDDILVFNVREKTLSRGDFLVRLTSSQDTLMYRLIFALVLRAPRVICTDELIELIWAADIDGGPLSADKIIYKTVCNIRQRGILEALGLEITTAYGRGYALNELPAKQVFA